mmetsp:Transcript_12176/g.18047  ORF Transcript_12176/g.18047 Transcript_12176/m.18047 type:complete len:135 (-) Transcript_12176:281-685(-)
MKSFAWSMACPGYEVSVLMCAASNDVAGDKARGMSANGSSSPDSKITSRSQGADRKMAEPLNVTAAVAAGVDTRDTASHVEHILSSSSMGVVISTVARADATFNFTTTTFLLSPMSIATLCAGTVRVTPKLCAL